MDPSQAKILVIDDEPDIVEFLSYNLQKEGYNIYTALNGKEGINIIKRITHHLILLDFDAGNGWI